MRKLLFISDQVNDEFSVGEGLTAVPQTEVTEVGEKGWGHEVPEFTGEGDVFYLRGGIRDGGGCGHLCEETLVHGDFVGVGVQMSFCKFHGFANHDAEDDAMESELVGSVEGGTDEVAIVNHAEIRLLGQ